MMKRRTFLWLAALFPLVRRVDFESLAASPILTETDPVFQIKLDGLWVSIFGQTAQGKIVCTPEYLAAIARGALRKGGVVPMRSKGHHYIWPMVGVPPKEQYMEIGDWGNWSTKG